MIVVWNLLPIILYLAIWHIIFITFLYNTPLVLKANERVFIADKGFAFYL